MRMRCGIAIVLILSLLPFGVACRSSDRSVSYQSIPPNHAERVASALQANESGLALAQDGRFVQAEEAFREALRLDISFAAAHNNLGLVLLQRQRFYEAAMEFRFAGRLRPDATEPVINLGRLYERVGWQKAAQEQFEKANRLGSEGKYSRGFLAQGARSIESKNLEEQK